MAMRIVRIFMAPAIILFCLNTSAAMGLYEKALEKYRSGAYTEVIELLNNKTVKDAGEYNLLGWAFLKTGDTVESKRQFQMSIAIEPTSYDSYCGLGFSFFQEGKFREALKNFDRGTSQGSKDIECLLARAQILEKLQDDEGAVDIYKKVLSLNKGNKIAGEKIKYLSMETTQGKKEEFVFFAKGDIFSMRIDGKSELHPFFIKGVDIGFGLPGRFPTEFPEDIDIYLEWFTLISEMNANVIRVYTILPPQFYRALYRFNHGRGVKDKLFLIQGIWVELPNLHDFRIPGYLEQIKQEIKNAVDVVHGNAEISHRYGHASGTYRNDVSGYVTAFIFGREWEPPAVIAYNNSSDFTVFNGRYLSIAGATPMEAWSTEMLDFLISYEAGNYNAMRPVALSNWPPLDPLFHQSEATFREEVEFRKKTGEIIAAIDYSKAFDEDSVDIDEKKIKVSSEFTPGIFVSYHVYPYYPDFLRHEDKYAKPTSFKDAVYYYNYLKELKAHYKNMPLLISEFGVPTSRGIARFHPEGMHHGGHNENEQAEILRRLTVAIRDAGCAGGIAFAWIDEWWKSNWMVHGMEERGRFWHNAEDPEENYGIMSVSPAGMEKLNGNPMAWKMAARLYSADKKPLLKSVGDRFEGGRKIRHLYADADAGYLYFRIDIAGRVEWDKVAYLIAIDTIGDKEGDHRLPFNLEVESPTGFEFVILIHGENSKILIDDKYNRMIFDISLLKFPGLSGYRENVDFKPIYNNNGLFTELITTHRRRFSRDGKVFPEKIYNASPLRHGKLQKDSLADFYYSRQNNFIEIRIPWNMLYVSDPSRMQVLYSNEEKRITNGIRAMVVSYKPVNIDDSSAMELGGRTNVTDMIPAHPLDMQYFRWKGWDTPEYIVRPKKAYYEMKEVYRTIENP